MEEEIIKHFFIHAPFIGQERIHTANHCFLPSVMSNICSEVSDANCSFVLYTWILHNIQLIYFIKTPIFPSNILPSIRITLI